MKNKTKRATKPTTKPKPKFGQWSTFLINKAAEGSLCTAGHEALKRWIALEKRHPGLNALELVKKASNTDREAVIENYLSQETRYFTGLKGAVAQYLRPHYGAVISNLARKFTEAVNKAEAADAKLARWPVPSADNSELFWYAEPAKEKK